MEGESWRKKRHLFGLVFVSGTRREGGDCVTSRVLWVVGEAGHEGRGVVEGGKDGLRRGHYLR